MFLLSTRAPNGRSPRPFFEAETIRPSPSLLLSDEYMTRDMVALQGSSGQTTLAWLHGLHSFVPTSSSSSAMFQLRNEPLPSLPY